MAAAAAMGAAAAMARAPCPLHSPKAKAGGKHHRLRPSWLPGDFATVVRRDREFLKKKLDPARARISKAIGDLFWLRNLEVEQRQRDGPPLVDNAWPTPSYPGLSGMDLLLADIEALKLYANYLLELSKVWSMPLSEAYDAQKVAVYFNSRPHILGTRVLEVLSAFALAAVKIQTSKRIKFNRFSKEEVTSEDSQYYFGHLLKEAILRLGPTFIKVGQSLSTRPDIIGPEISKALSELQDNIPPFPRSEAIKTIEEELGSPVEDVFSYISEETVAAASFGQVYKGCTIDGHTVAIKVQRPNLLHVVVRDIYILRLGLGLLRKIAKRKNDIRLYADELGRGFIGELDYRLEALNATEFQEAHAQYRFISVPKVFKHLSRKKILTMSWLVGENPNKLFLLSNGPANGDACLIQQQADAKKRLLDLVNKGVKASLIQLLETGLLHADPHPGNLCYTHAGQIGFLDFGLLCRMEKRHQLAMLASIIHIVICDWEALVEDLSQMDVVPPKTNIRCVTRDLEQTLGEMVLVDGVPDIKFSKVLGKIWSIALKYHFRMPPYYTLVLRSLASFEGLAVAADPEFKTFQAVCPYVVQKLIYDNSLVTRRILQSVVFNKRREFQWQNLSLFLKIGFTRKDMEGLTKSDASLYPDSSGRSADSVVGAASLVLRLLTSNDGTVVRRLLMNVESRSLVRAMISNEAVFFRQQVSRALADVIYQLITKTLGVRNIRTQDDEWHSVNREQGSEIGPAFPGLSSPAFSTVMSDHRLKVIFYKVVRSIRTDPVLLLRFCWSCFAAFLWATALALHRVAISLSETYITSSVSSGPKRFSVSL